jgi:TolB-like protein
VEQKMRICLVLILGLFLLANAEDQGLAVRDFIAAPADSNLARQFSDALTAEIVKLNRYKILERSQIATILEEQAFSNSGTCDQESCLVEMGKLLGVDLLVIGQLGRLDNSISINAKLLDIQTGEIKSNVFNLHKDSESRLISSAPKTISAELFGIKPVTSAYKTPSLIATGVLSIVLFGTGIYFDRQIDPAIKKYRQATTTPNAISAREQIEGHELNRNLSYVGSALLASGALSLYFVF